MAKHITLATPTAPDSYVDERRPTLARALVLEGKGSHAVALQSLQDKGYFTPPPRPWSAVGEEMHGELSCAVVDRFGDIVCKTRARSTADLIVTAVMEFDLMVQKAKKK